MSADGFPITRRRMLAGAGALCVGGLLPPGASKAAGALITRPIPKTGERIPALGMGTWITFNVGRGGKLRAARLEVLKMFFDMGGGMVDSSPMYGSAQDVIGWCLNHMPDEEKRGLFSATKVWTPAGGSGAGQVADAKRLWNIPAFDLMQIHNLVDWRDHLAMLREKKAAGEIRHIGITTSHGSRHSEMIKILKSEELDFVQFTYNVLDREAEKVLLPLSAERGAAVIVNRPFRRGGLFDHIGNAPPPSWAKEIGAENWAQVLLKFIISHPAVTCAIPATSKTPHMVENMNALKGPLPDAALRKRIIETVESL